MNTIWLLILFLVLVLFGTSGPRADAVVREPVIVTMDPEPIPVEINGNPGVILDVSEYGRDLDGWTPEIVDLQAAEDAVLAAPADDRSPQLEGYRQYVGIIENGQHKIVVNSMCSESEGWETTYVEVMDGGSCFWNALYNVDTGELEYLVVNGEA